MEYEVLKYVGAGIACFGMIGAALGVGNIFASIVDGIARNPSTEQKLFSKGIIGAAMAEALGILAFAVAILLMYGV